MIARIGRRFTAAETAREDEALAARLTRDEEALQDLADRAEPVTLCGAAYPLDPARTCARHVDSTGTHPGVHDSDPSDHTRGVAWRDDV